MLPYKDNPGQTHWGGCYRSIGHHNCAVAEIERLSKLLGSKIPSMSLNATFTKQDIRDWIINGCYSNADPESFFEFVFDAVNELDEDRSWLDINNELI